MLLNIIALLHLQSINIKVVGNIVDLWGW